ncbi:hypothetical protein BGZ60DRAFT_530532 [Tricladium varicosporioides]|nr:hypothetical protein BGZ60DRAFT_530532 [Hymenoscyphus varicosporioides]
MSADLPSSNPFRRKNPTVVTSVSPDHPSEQITHHDPEPLPRSTSVEVIDAPKKIMKKVRVQSPPPPSPSIPDSASTVGEEAFLTAAQQTNPIPQNEDPFGNKMIEYDIEDSGGNSISKVPANPFSRTLETMEHPERGINAAPQPNVSSPGRASLDVEAFKRLLMTGNAGTGKSSTPPPIPAHAAHHSLGDGGSSTDTSSISRQSIFETIQEAHPESPRSSHEISEPDDERRGLTTGLQRSASNRKAPPPPNSRHGKLIRVELRDEPSINTVYTPPTPPTSTGQNYFASSPVHSNRSQTDLNKPLPPAPNRASHESDRESVFDKEAAGKTPEPPSPSSSIRRKTPPVPPIARRRSQMISDSKLNRSNSGRLSPKVEEDTISISEAEAGGRPRSGSGRAPPPPPSRRPASIKGILHDPSSPPLTSPSSISLPAPPPARGSTRHSSGGRPPSVISLDMSTNNKRASIIPPPPPPHRHGRSSMDAQSSGDSRRPSGEQSRRSIESARRGSGASSVSQYERIDAQPASNDILADLSALQKEIDALRTQSEKERIT